MKNKVLLSLSVGLVGLKRGKLAKSAVPSSNDFGAGWKAVSVRSLTFEQRQIEDCSFQQSWPFSCALQLCCWDVDLKSNSFGSRPSIMKK